MAENRNTRGGRPKRFTDCGVEAVLRAVGPHWGGGAGEIREGDIVMCDLCDSTGWEPIESNGARTVRRCACWYRAHPSRVAGVPKFFESARLENYEPQPGTHGALAAAKRWLKGTHDLFLAGSVGCGKSRMACSLANEVGNAGTSSAFFDVSDFITRVRTAEFDRDDLVNPLGVARAVDVLVLDDVGAAEKASDYTLRVLLGLYNFRLGEQKRTIWTSNHTLDGLGSMWQDDRLPSRIAGAAEVVQITAEDFRVTGAKAWRTPA